MLPYGGHKPLTGFTFGAVRGLAAIRPESGLKAAVQRRVRPPGQSPGSVRPSRARGDGSEPVSQEVLRIAAWRAWNRRQKAGRTRGPLSACGPSVPAGGPREAAPSPIPGRARRTPQLRRRGRRLRSARPAMLGVLKSVSVKRTRDPASAATLPESRMYGSERDAVDAVRRPAGRKFFERRPQVLQRHGPVVVRDPVRAIARGRSARIASSTWYWFGLMTLVPCPQSESQISRLGAGLPQHRIVIRAERLAVIGEQHDDGVLEHALVSEESQ